MVLENPPVLVFSHEQDVDGIFSAAILKLVFGNPRIVLTNYGLENSNYIQNQIISAAKENNGGKVIVADLGPNPESIAPIVDGLTFAFQKNWECFWIDHHIWSDEMKSRVGAVCELVLCPESVQEKKCTAELCVEKFDVKTGLALQLASIARRTDFPDTTKYPIPPLTALISYYVGFRDLHDKLISVVLENVCKGIYWNFEMQQDIIEASRLIDESIERSISSLERKEIIINSTSYSIAIVKADPFVSRSILLGRVMDENEIDVAAAFTEDGKISLRRKETENSQKLNIDCSKLAQEFKEGGGHSGAAGGFLFNKPGSDDNNLNAIAEIMSAFESYLNKRSQQTSNSSN